MPHTSDFVIGDHVVREEGRLMLFHCIEIWNIRWDFDGVAMWHVDG
jgi:hypothetical protein